MAAGVPVPLAGVRAEAHVTDLLARVTITQRYRNAESQPIEAVYVFPLDERSAVCGFEAIVAGVHYAGEVKEREEAFWDYDDAIVEGHGAYLLDEERPDVFAASLGNVPPGTEVQLRLTHVTELAFEGDAVRFVLPTTVSPRYAPIEDQRGVGRPEAEALNPPLDWSVSYGLEMEVTFAMSGAILGVESPSHPVSVRLDGMTAVVTLAERSTPLDRDVVVLVTAANAGQPRLLVECDDHGQHAAAVVFRPSFGTATAPSELVFVVDRSGSMDGTSIAEVRNALQLAIRSLVPGCRFNIVGFGSSIESLWAES
jgi:Ca-activated chloride channel family protein